MCESDYTPQGDKNTPTIEELTEQLESMTVCATEYRELYEQTKRKLDYVVSVNNLKEWDAADRVAWNYLWSESNKSADAHGNATWTTLTKKRASAYTGIKPGRVGEALAKFEAAGLIHR